MLNRGLMFRFHHIKVPQSKKGNCYKSNRVWAILNEVFYKYLEEKKSRVQLKNILFDVYLYNQFVNVNVILHIGLSKILF